MCQIVEILRLQPNCKRKWRVGVVAVILILILIAIVVAAVIIVLRRSAARVRTSTSSSSSTAWRRPAVAIVVVVVVVASLRRCRRRRRHPDKVLTLIPCFAEKSTISRIVLMTFRTPPSPLSNVEPCGWERISFHGRYFLTLGLFHSLFG